MARFVMSTVDEGRIRLVAVTNASDVVTSIELEADAGTPGNVTAFVRATGFEGVIAPIRVEATGAMKRSTYNVPNPRRWTWGRDDLPSPSIEMSWDPD